jgi:hypothetical protein
MARHFGVGVGYHDQMAQIPVGGSLGWRTAHLQYFGDPATPGSIPAFSTRLAAVHHGNCGASKNVGRALACRGDRAQDTGKIGSGAGFFSARFHDIEHIADPAGIAGADDLQVHTF